MLNFHMRTRDGTPVTILHQGTLPFEQSANNATVLICCEHNNKLCIGYRNADGTHPNKWSHLDLVDYDTVRVEGFFMALPPAVSQSCLTLYRNVSQTAGIEALNAAIRGCFGQQVNISDIERFMTERFGQ